eukprot:jgi/Chlat1/3/ChrspC215549S00726
MRSIAGSVPDGTRRRSTSACLDGGDAADECWGGSCSAIYSTC